MCFKITHSKTNSKPSDGTSLHFSPLTPKDDLNSLQGYNEALDFVFQNEKIRNIALSGAYGSGKSSVMASYENQHIGKHFIHISLAHFKEQESNAVQSFLSDVAPTSLKNNSHNSNDSQQSIVNVLEGKILNQLLHQIPSQKITQSHFRIKKETTRRQTALLVFAVAAFVVSLLFVTYFNKWTKIITSLAPSLLQTILLYTTAPGVQLIWMALCLLLFVVGLYYLLKNHNFQKIFKKVDLNGIVGIELFESTTDSYFDKYLNEVLYLFENSQADAIVFEDLDRYEVTKIFEKLHEINDLIYRKSSQKKLGKRKQKTLRFFYLIRDDVFTNSDRSKFFDFIIPIVPIVDTSNACEKLLEQFGDIELGDAFNRRFLQDISLYLSDMRLLTNIVNEYIVYHERLKDSGLTPEPDRQLAMLIYKNLYPKDFNLLQHGQGYVFELLQNKSKLLQLCQHRTDNEIATIRTQILSAENEKLKDIKELNAVFFPLHEEILSINGQNISPKTSRSELIEMILCNPNQVKYRAPAGSTPLNVNAKRTEMEQNEEYLQRKEIIENRVTANRHDLEFKISIFEKRKSLMATMSIKELLGQLDGDDDIFWNCELPPYNPDNYVAQIKNSKGFSLLKYLIRNGYINENYASHISYFYPNSLSANDHNFLLALADRKSLGYEYRLDSPQEVIARLNSSDFLRKEIRNFSLLEELLKSENYTLLRPWFCALEDANITDHTAFNFLLQFWRIDRARDPWCFVRVISREFPHWFRKWTDDNLFNNSDWRLFALDTICYSEEKALLEVNQDNWLAARIAADPDFLCIIDPDVNKIIAAFDLLKIKSHYISYERQTPSVVDGIYKHNLYVLNLPNIKTIMAYYWHLSEGEVEQKSYTYLRGTPSEPLAKRVMDNLEEYMEVILQESDAHFGDEEDAVIELLNHPDISDESKLTYIRRLDSPLTELKQVENTSLWPALMTPKNVKYTWENIADYFASQCGDDNEELPAQLAEFINSSDEQLNWSWDTLNSRIGKGTASQLRKAIVKSSAVSLPRYRTAIASLTFSYNEFPTIACSEDRLKVLFDLKVISMTTENIEIVKDQYPTNFIDFIVTVDTAKFVELVQKDDVVISREDLEALLKDGRIGETAALQLLDSFSGPISLLSKDFSPSVKAKIIENHFDTSDIPQVLYSFRDEDEKVKHAFVLYAKRNIDQIITNAKAISLMPVELYANCLSELTPEQAQELRQYLQNENFDIACSQNRNPAFPDTPYNRTILDYYVAQGWISSYMSAPKNQLRVFSKRRDISLV